jgi:ATP-dependent HslUV protease ATP-binding subunit HslU
MEVLTYDDYLRILTETDYNIIQQQVELLRVEGVEIAFEKAAVERLARTAVELNEEDNIGARRL